MLVGRVLVVQFHEINPTNTTVYRQQPCLHPAPVTTCLDPQPTVCTAPCLNLSLSRSSSKPPHPAAAWPPARSTVLDRSQTPPRAALFSLIPLVRRPVPPWVSAAQAAHLVLVWALLLEVLALQVSGWIKSTKITILMIYLQFINGVAFSFVLGQSF